MGKKVFIKTLAAGMNEYDSDKMVDVMNAAGAGADAERGRGRPDPVQHLLGAGKGAEGLQ